MKQSAGRPFRNSNVAKVFAAYPDHIRGRLMTLRTMIFEIAADLDGVGPLEETLKWSQPSYLTTQSGSGSTIRIDQVKSDDARLAIYFHCQTDLVATFRELYPTQMEYGGNRSILFDAEAKDSGAGAPPLHRACADLSRAQGITEQAAFEKGDFGKSEFQESGGEKISRYDKAHARKGIDTQGAPRTTVLR